MSEVADVLAGVFLVVLALGLVLGLFK